MNCRNKCQTRHIVLYLCVNVTVIVNIYYIGYFRANCAVFHPQSSTIGNRSSLTLGQREQLMIMHSRAMWNNAPKNIYHVDIDQLDIKSMSASDDTVIQVFSGGFCHFRGLYIARGNEFYVVSKTPNNVTTIFGDQFRLTYCFPPTAVAHIVTFEQLIRIFSGQTEPIAWPQTTLIDFQDNTTVWLRHYFHFMEELISLWLMLSSAVTSPNVVRLLFPGDLKDSFVPNSFNDVLIKAAFGKTLKVMHDTPLNEKQTPIRIESVLTESRQLSHAHDVLSSRNNAMSWGICRVLWSPKPIEALQHQVFRYLNISSLASEQPLILYIDRQAAHQRRLSDRTHAELLAELATLRNEGWLVVVTKMEELSFREQVSLAAQAHVIVGVHGNGLSNIFWARSNAGLIEFQPRNKRQMHYEWLAQVASLNYASLDSEGIEWVARYNSPTDHMNYINITIDSKLVTKIARSWKGRVHESRWRMQNYF